MKTVPIERLRALLLHDAAKGVLIWQARGIPAWDARYAGTRAGTLTSEGYRTLSIDDESFREHRVIWALAHGAWPGERLDHSDLNRAGNKAKNLREASSSQNVANSKARRRNKLKVKGVHYEAARNSYRAQIGYKGKKYNLGNFKTLAAARAAYRDTSNVLFDTFARQ